MVDREGNQEVRKVRWRRKGKQVEKKRKRYGRNRGRNKGRGKGRDDFMEDVWMI